MNVLYPSTLRKMHWRFAAYAAFLFFIAYLDRVNVGFAALQMNKDLAFTSTVFGFGAGIFFIGYALFEIPSNMVLYRVGSGIWIGRIMITWGLLASALAFVQGEYGFYVLRFLIGVAEAGFAPGILYFLSEWFPRSERGKANAIFLIGAPLSLAIGAPVSTLIIDLTNGAFGFPGWRWMFLVEGIPAIVFGIFTIFYLPRSLDQIHWLNAEERQALKTILDEDRSATQTERNFRFRDAFREPRVLVVAMLFFFLAIGIYGIIFWLPQIINGLGTLTRLQIGLLAGFPYVVATGAMWFVAKWSDQTGERRMFLFACLAIAAVTLAGSAYAPPALALVLITIATAAVWSALGPMWALPTSLLTGAAAACGLAYMNTISMIGGFVGPYVVGIVKDATGSFQAALLALAGSLFIAALIAIAMRFGRAGKPDVPDTKPIPQPV